MFQEYLCCAEGFNSSFNRYKRVYKYDKQQNYDESGAQIGSVEIASSPNRNGLILKTNNGVLTEHPVQTANTVNSIDAVHTDYNQNPPLNTMIDIINECKVDE